MLRDCLLPPRPSHVARPPAPRHRRPRRSARRPPQLHPPPPPPRLLARTSRASPAGTAPSRAAGSGGCPGAGRRDTDTDTGPGLLSLQEAPGVAAGPHSGGPAMAGAFGEAPGPAQRRAAGSGGRHRCDFSPFGVLTFLCEGTTSCCIAVGGYAAG